MKIPPKVLKKWGWWILPGSQRLRHLVLILGRRADHHMIFHIFSIPFLPWVFQRRLFKVLRKKNEIHCIFFVSRHIETPNATRLGEKNIIWPKKIKFSGSPQAQSVVETVCSRHRIDIFLQHYEIMLHLCSKHKKRKKRKKMREKEAKCQTGLAEGGRACVSTDRGTAHE